MYIVHIYVYSISIGLLYVQQQCSFYPNARTYSILLYVLMLHHKAYIICLLI